MVVRYHQFAPEPTAEEVQEERASCRGPVQRSTGQGIPWKVERIREGIHEVEGGSTMRMMRRVVVGTMAGGPCEVQWETTCNLVAHVVHRVDRNGDFAEGAHS
jgi:hypothetical protein